ncbi:MAG TPA: ATP-binding cassette domain-containing protein [Candidatus Limnocylindrales bacterium]|nr:ATP-binding cassette domain-containing protein [Candidatus Limnocylindrales bacterium]
MDTGGPSSSLHPVVGIALGDRATIKIGRAIDNDLELDDVRVSRHHAELRRGSSGALEIIDLQSHNGTFVNGRRVRSQRVTDGDYIGVGGQTLHLVAGELRVAIARDTAWFGAIDLVVTAGGHRILDEVGFALEPSSVLAVVGTSGSGKSTLLNALTGFRPADSGSVVFGGRDLYAAYDDLRSRMGLVPQADILHTQLTVRQALSYEAELRFPTDVRREKRIARVDEVIAELHLTERANVRIDRLSGGQRKRVSVASELLTQPTLLFLDEPTSGLDPGNEADLMTLLRDLARAGRTVVVVTHSVQSLDLCDRVVVMAPGGRLGYYGPPQEALRYFGEVADAKTYPDIFHQLEQRKDIDWKARFRADTAYGQYVRDPLGSPDLEAIPRRPNIDPPPAPTPVGHQLWVLVRRYLAVIRADRGFLFALALQAPIFGLLFSLMYTTNVMTTNDALNASVLIWLVIVGATWLGTSNAIREIVKELPIYHRERAIGLSAGAYVLSKVIVLGFITAIQTAILVPIALRTQLLPAVDELGSIPTFVSTTPVHIASTGVILPTQLPELVVVAIAVGLASMGLGLLVSSLAGGVDRAATLLPIVLVTQVIVSVPLIAPSSVILGGIGDVMSAQWGMAAAASTVDLQEIRGPYVALTVTAKLQSSLHRLPTGAELNRELAKTEQPRWRHAATSWFADMGFLAALAVLSVVGAWLALRRTDPDLMEGRHRGRFRRSLLARLGRS